jgi:hypothetical protein
MTLRYSPHITFPDVHRQAVAVAVAGQGGGSLLDLFHACGREKGPQR